jgi:hypothetical protein
MFAPSWSAKIEYQYYDFGNRNFTYLGAFNPGVRNEEQTVKLGLNYRISATSEARLPADTKDNILVSTNFAPPRPLLDGPLNEVTEQTLNCHIAPSVSRHPS